MNPQFPVYVISKGRWESRLTVKALQWMKVPFHVVVEPQEFDRYANVIPKENIYTLPFSNLGQGGIPARNWCWEHSISVGAERHWILDDNISGFVKLTDNRKIQVKTGTFFRIIEDFVERYDNVAFAGPHYDFLAKRKQKLPPIYWNRRVYSCILIKNDLPYRWRGRYNEDTDLSLRALKDGWSTVLFLHHLACKSATMTMKGGNTDQLYADDNHNVAKSLTTVNQNADKITWKLGDITYSAKSGSVDQWGKKVNPLFKDLPQQIQEELLKTDGRLMMAKSLYDQHPDVCEIRWKFGRWQHHVNYSPFEYNNPKPKPWVEKIPFDLRVERLELVQIGEPA